jgi:DNA polymerase I
MKRIASDGPPTLVPAETLERASATLGGYPGLGMFIAYLIACDLYPDAADALSWGFAGDGARRGLDRLYGRPFDVKGNSRLRQPQALAEIRAILPLLQRRLADCIPSIVLRTVEHNLCELDKYERVKLGQGPGRRYTPPHLAAAVQRKPKKRPARHPCPEGQERPQAPITAKVGRARKDRIGTAIAVAAGVRWRWCGVELVWDGFERLAQPDQVFLEGLRPEIEQRLADPAEADPEWVLDALEIEAELITDPVRAAEVIAGLPRVVGVDTETAARPEHAPTPTWLAVTKTGRRAAHQPKPKDKTALDPRRACPRLLQVYDPRRKTTFVFEWRMLVDHGLVQQLLARQVLVHNALFDLQMLLAEGIEPPDVVDITQLAVLALGPGERGRDDGEPQLISLKYVAEQVLNLELSKDLQASDWSAPNLTDAQIAYAAADPCIAYRAGRAIRQWLSEREMQAFRLANAAIPVIARMTMRGLPFDRAIHAETIRTWELEYAGQREQFRQQTGLEVPVGAPAIRAWLAARLPQEALETWPKTPSGLLLASSAEEIKRLAQDHCEVLPLLAVQKKEKRLSTFGAALADQVSPVTGRLHGDYALPTVTGRLACRRPNLQQLPGDARAAVRAGPGKVLLSADYGQIELRILAERAGEAVMRAAFAAGKDIHTVTAARFLPHIWSLPEKDPERILARKRAKAVNFGLPYGMGAETLRRKAWKDYELDLSYDEIVLIRDAWFDTYPAIKPYQMEQYSHRFDAVWSIAGRPRRACWMPAGKNGGPGELWYTYCCNFGVQSSASDLLLEAMAMVDKTLPGMMIASVHDELLLEVSEDHAEHAAGVLAEQMLDAFVHWFPEAPTTGVVEVKIVNNWSEAK